MTTLAKINDKSSAPMSISSHYWSNLLTLLMSASRYPFSRVKRRVFCDVAIELKYIIDPTVKMTRTDIEAWMDNYQRAETPTPATLLSDDYLSHLLMNIKPYGHKVDILTSLVRISIADGSYDDFEQELTKKVILLWCLPITLETDIEYICLDLMAIS